MKILKRILIMTMIFIMLLPLSVNIINVSAADTVNLTLTPQPYIDVVLAKAKTTTQLNNFETDLRAALKTQGVDNEKVNITAIQAQIVNIQNAFEWEQDQSDSIGRITIGNQGRNVTMIGNYSNPGKNAIWIIPTSDLVQTFKFGYSIAFGDSFNAAGMLLRVQDHGTYLTGYMLSFNNYNWTGDASGQNGAIWKFTYYKKQNGVNIEKSIVKPLSISMSGTLTVKVTKQEIEVTETGKTPITVNIESDPRGAGFGFFSDHYSHGCDQYGQFTLTDINLETENSKTFEEVLREPSWREDAIKVLVNVEDVENKQLSEPESLGELLARMINDEIYYVGWGKDATQSQAEKFIKSNNEKGKFINNTDYNTSINQTAEYIKSLIPTNKGSQYVLLTDNTLLSTADSNIMKNTAYGAFPNGRWKILHDCEYFENNIGQFAEAGKYLKDMITSFNKTGKYEIFYEDRNVEPSEIYVHRKPVAEFTVAKSNTTLTFTDLSYDLDKYNNSRGIKQAKWEYKQVGTDTWIQGKPANTNVGTDFLVQLTVQDFQDTWSAPVSKYITTNNSVPPIASFKIKNRNTSIYEELEIIDGSYDPFGGTITNKEWKLYKKDGSLLTTTTTNPILDYTTYGVGEYTLGLKVTNNRGMTSEEFKRTFTIIPDDEAPEFVAKPTDCEWTKSVEVNLTFTDRLGSGFASYNYAITDSQSPATTWSEDITKENDKIIINTDGEKYLHIKARDHAGNESVERILGPYKIDRTPPAGDVTHDTSWVIDYTVLNWSFSDPQSGWDRVQLPNKEISTNASGSYTVTENGDYTFTVYDKLGNSRTITENVSNIDKTPPEIVLSLDQEKFTNDPINIRWQVVDTQSGVANIVLPNNNDSELTSGEFQISTPGTYTFIAYDNVGNSKIMSIKASNVDMRIPKITITQKYTKWTNSDVQLHYKAEDADTGIEEVVLPASGRVSDAEGNYMVTKNGVYTFIAYDKSGNGVIGQHEVNNIDKEEPELILTLSEDNTKIKWSISDSQSGFDYVVLPTGETVRGQSSGEFTITKNGTYTFVGYDKVGNYRIKQITR